MLEELILLKEYCTSLGLTKENVKKEDLEILKNELKENGEYGLSQWVASLEDPGELVDYLTEED